MNKPVAAAIAIPDPLGGAPAALLDVSQAGLKTIGSRKATSISHLVRITESDPALAFNLFAAVNPALARAGRPPAESIQHAILILGVPAFLERMATSPVFVTDDPDPATCALLDMLARGYHASRQARAFAECLPSVSADAVVAAALSRHGLEFTRVLVEATAGAATEAMGDENSLPPLAQDGDPDDPGRRCIALGNHLAEDVQYHWDNAALQPTYEAVAKLVGGEPDAAERLIKVGAVATARADAHFRRPPAALNLFAPDRRCGPKVPSAEPSEDTADDAVGDDQSLRLDHRLRELARLAGDNRSSTSIISCALEGVCADVGFQIAFFLLRDARAGKFALRLGSGASLPQRYDDFFATDRLSPLLVKLMRKERVVKLDPKVNPELIDKLEANLARLVGRHFACLQSLIIGGKPLGVVFACRPTSADADVNFRRLGKALKQALEIRRQQASQS